MIWLQLFSCSLISMAAALARALARALAAQAAAVVQTTAFRRRALQVAVQSAAKRFRRGFIPRQLNLPALAGKSLSYKLATRKWVPFPAHFLTDAFPEQVDSHQNSNDANRWSYRFDSRNNNWCSMLYHFVNNIVLSAFFKIMYFFFAIMTSKLC